MMAGEDQLPGPTPVDVSVTIAETVQLPEATTFADSVRAAIGESLAQRRYEPREFDGLRIVVTELGIDQRQVRAGLLVTGTLAGDPVDKPFVQTCLLDVADPTLGRGIATLLGGGVGAGIWDATHRSEDRPPALKKLQTCLDKCAADACLLIECLLVEGAPDRGEPDLAARWRAICTVRWIVSIPVFISGFIAPVFVVRVDAPALVMLFFALIHAAAAFGTVHLFGLSIMPSRFYLNDPRGTKALAQFGMKNILAMRILCIFAGLALLSLVACTGTGLYGIVE